MSAPLVGEGIEAAGPARATPAAAAGLRCRVAADVTVTTGPVVPPPAVVVAGTAVILVAGLVMGRPFLEMLRTAIVLAVATIPEGLLIAVTVILAFVAPRSAFDYADEVKTAGLE